MRLGRQLTSALLLLGLAPSGLSPAAPVPSSERHGVLVTVAETSSDRATLWVRGDATTPVHVRYAPVDAPRAPSERTLAIDRARDRTGRAVLDGLAPDTRYAYEATQDAAEARGTFVTAPAPGADVAARLVWSGDLGANNYCRDVEDGYAIFRAVAHHHPDFFLFLRDTLYA